MGGGKREKWQRGALGKATGAGLGGSSSGPFAGKINSDDAPRSRTLWPRGPTGFLDERCAYRMTSWCCFFFFWHILGCTFWGLAWFPLAVPVVMTDVHGGRVLGSDSPGLLTWFPYRTLTPPSKASLSHFAGGGGMSRLGALKSLAPGRQHVAELCVSRGGAEFGERERCHDVTWLTSSAF